MLDTRNRVASLVLAAAICTLVPAACSSPKPKPKPKPVPAYRPPPPPPLEDLMKEAVEAERAGAAARGFSAVYGLDEAVRAYSRVVNHYPKSAQASAAKEKIRELAGQVAGIRAWKRKIDSVKNRMGKTRGIPRGLHPLHGELVKMKAEAPEGFVREGVSELMDHLDAEYEEAALKEVAEAAGRAREALDRNDLRDAFTAWATVPDFYGEDLPSVAGEIEKHRAVMEDTASKRAQKELGRAETAMRRHQERQALAILRQAWPEYKGFRIAGEIVRREREAALAVLKVLCKESSGTTRKIDKELFSLIEEAAALRPDVKSDREKIRDFLAQIDKIMDRYRASLEEFSMTSREFEIRRARLEKLLNWERKRLDQH